MNELINLINQWIKANGNNEITGEILQNVLLEIVAQPNLLIGDINAINTTSKNLVGAVNELKELIEEIEGIAILQGLADPNVVSPTQFKPVDFYLQINSSNQIVALYQYDGSQWINLSNKVDKVDGFGLSQENFTTALKDKLIGIEEGAEVNVVNTLQEVINAGDNSDAATAREIKISSTDGSILLEAAFIASLKGKDAELVGDETANVYAKRVFIGAEEAIYFSTDNTTDNTATLIGLMPDGKLVNRTLNIGDVDNLEGLLDGKADLVDGIIPSSQLPAFVDDVKEFLSLNDFPLVGESSTIYIAKDTNQTYRWTGTTYVIIGNDLALGETSSSAYRGDRGKAAYDHSLLVSGNPHNTSKTDVGLGNVDNTSDLDKPLSSAALLALNNKVDTSVGFLNEQIKAKQAVTAVLGTDLNTVLPFGGFVSSYFNQSWADNAPIVGYGGFVKFKDFSSISALEFYYENGHFTNKGRLFFRTRNNQNLPAWKELVSSENINDFSVKLTGNSVINGNLTATSFIKQGGLSSQFLKADGSVDNREFAPLVHTHELSEVNSLISVLSDKADLVGGTIPASQLPSYVDDILEFSSFSVFPIVGEASKIYVDLTDNNTYRWTGSVYVSLNEGVVLGTTSSTAFRGDYGQAAYDHSLLVSGNPHNTSKTDVGLGNVDNTSDLDKPLSSAAISEFLTKMPLLSGNTASRPLSPSVGTLYYDTDIQRELYWDGTQWNAFPRRLVGIKVHDFPSIANNSSSTTTITVVGAQVGDFVESNPPANIINLNLNYSVAVTAIDTVTIKLSNNNSGGSINPPSANYKVYVVKD